MADDVQVTVQELSAALTDQIDDADLTRARGLADLLDIRLARLDGLRRELELRRGVDDADPRLAILQQQLLVDEATVRSLDLEALRAATPPVAAVADAAMVQGRLVAAEGELPAGARVRLRDASGKLVSNVEGTLDASGGFSLKVPLEAGPSIDLSKVTVVVSDASGKELARDERVILPAAGTVDYREITLPIRRRAGGAASAGAAGAAGTIDAAGSAVAGSVAAGSAAAGAAASGAVVAGSPGAGSVASPVAPGSVAPGPVVTGPVVAGPVVAGPVVTGPLTGTLPGRVIRATSTRAKASTAKAATPKKKAGAKTTKAKAKASSAKPSSTESAKPADAGGTTKPSTGVRVSRTTKPASTGGGATGSRRTTTGRSPRTPRRPT